MSSYPAYRPRGPMSRLLGGADDFMNWMLYGYETWLVAVLKGVPLFLFIAWRTGGISLRPGQAPGVYRGRAANWNRPR